MYTFNDDKNFNVNFKYLNNSFSIIFYAAIFNIIYRTVASSAMLVNFWSILVVNSTIL